MSEILKCPWCDKRRATQLDYDTLQPGEGTDLCWASPMCELDGDEEVVLALRLALETATRERDDIAAWAKSCMKRVAAAERERDEARAEAKRLMSLTQNWYEGRARIGSHMTFVDQRFYDSVRAQRTGWPGDDADGDGGPPEE